MKKLVLAMVMVLTFSSAALAVSYGSGTVTLSGQNTWTNGALTVSNALHNTTLTLSTTDTKNNWKGNAEFVINAGTATNNPKNQTNGTFTLNDVYLQMTALPFTFELWNWGEDGQGVDYKTPLEWVFADNAPGSNWATRATVDIAGVNTVFQVKNDKEVPQYYLFGKKAINEGTTVGAAYKTTFNDNNVADGWVTTDLGPVVVTGEVAYNNFAGAVDSEINFGAKAAFDSKINLYGYVNNVADKKYAEAVVFDVYRGTVTSELAGTKTTIDLKARKSNDQAIGDIFNVDNDFFDINVPGDNDWLKNKGWAAGANIVLAKGDDAVLTLYGQVAPSDKINALVAVVKDGTDMKAELRGYYVVSDKLAVHPRVFLNEHRKTSSTGLGAYDEKAFAFGSYVSYKVTKGMLVGGLWLENDEDYTEAAKVIEAGYELSF